MHNPGIIIPLPERFEDDRVVLELILAEMDLQRQETPPRDSVTMARVARAHGLAPLQGRVVYRRLRAAGLINKNTRGRGIALPYDYNDDTIHLTERGMALVRDG